MDSYSNGKAASRDDALQFLEGFIDVRDVPQLCSVLAELCAGKADHLRQNWQDEKAAKAWDRLARKFVRVTP